MIALEPEWNKLWACSRPMGQYRGIYPGRFLERVDELIPILSGNLKVLHQFGGTTKIHGHDTVDINPEVNPTHLCDARTLEGIDDQTYDVVLADPPYDGTFVDYSSKLYKCEKVKPYSFVDAGLRVLKPRGYYLILHQLVYGRFKGLKQTERVGVIAITTGPNMRIRVLNIFQKS